MSPQPKRINYVPDDTTTDLPEADNNDENWASRYTGLQKVLSKRDADLTARQVELDAIRAEKAAVDTELASYRQVEVDASEEEAAEALYEQLRAKFEPRPPQPIANASAREWMDPESRQYADKSDDVSDGGSSGWPT